MNEGYRVLYGDFESKGVSLRRVYTQNSRNWTQVMESGAIHLFMNLRGNSLVFGPAPRLPMVSKTIGVAHIGDINGMIACCNVCDEGNEIIVLCVTPEWVNKNFGSRKKSLHENLVMLLDKKTQHSVLLNKVRSMSYLEYELCSSLLAPPVHKDARSFWFLAKILELLSLHLFKSPTLERNKERSGGEHGASNKKVDKALIWLEEHYDEPLDLKKMSASMFCSASYLSRVFRESKGITITGKLREIRVEKASELLRGGDYNVTEAAMEVGYNSLSHFTKAFKEVKGINPSEYLKRSH